MILNAQAIRDKVAQVLRDHSGVGGRNVKLEGDEKGSAFVVNPFQSEKSQILLETRAFNESPPQARKCCNILTKVLFLITSSGESLSVQQKTDLFFATTKLFQSNDLRLRRLVYLLVKTIEPSEAEVFIITSSLTKDMNSGSDCYRANAIRVLSRIIDPSMAVQIERYLKTAIVDTNPFVASSALVCGMTLMRTSPEVVRRWVNEVQQSVLSRHSMVQFHALVLLHELKGSDRLALHKVVGSLTKSFLKSNLAECMLIRYATEVLQSERDPSLQKQLIDYLESCLRHKAEVTMFEAARAFCDLAIFDKAGHGGSTIFGPHDILPALTVLQVFLSSPRPVLRFAAVRTLNRLAEVRPHVVSRANADLEPLLTDSARNISTLALTTLLKTGHESSVDRLIKQISNFMSEISDVFKSDIVKGVKQLCLAYPNKHKVLMSFLSSNLREEGSFEHKSDIVDSLIFLSQKIPAAQEVGILHLCEFIEDCEYASLCTQILSFLGQQAPVTANPSKYIRFIHNRLILENAQIRASGVDALSKIAMKCPTLRSDILLLLDCCLTDNDDEVRDRTNLYYRSVKASIAGGTVAALPKDLLVDDDDKRVDSSDTASTVSTAPSIEELLDMELPVSLTALCDTLQKCAESQFDETSLAELDIKNLPTEEKYRTAVAAARPSAAAGAVDSNVEVQHVSAVAVPATETAQLAHGVQSASNRDLFAKLAPLISEDDLGALCHSGRATPLTEKEAEYTVMVTKHVFPRHMVCEFYITNTMLDQTLERVQVNLASSDEHTTAAWTAVGSIPIASLPFSAPASVYTLLSKNQQTDGDSSGPTVGFFGASLTFLLKETGDTIGYEDQYSIEPLHITIGDYCVPRPLRQGEFRAVWDSLESQGHEATAKLSLSFKSLEAAVEGLPSSLNLAACEKSDSLADLGRSSRTLLLSGTFAGGWQILCKAMVVMSPDHGCLLKMVVRSKNESVCQSVLKAFD